MNIYYYSHQVYQLSFAIQLYKQLGGFFLVRKLNRKLRLKWYCRKSQRKNAIDSILISLSLKFTLISKLLLVIPDKNNFLSYLYLCNLSSI